MPVHRCDNGKYRIGSGPCMYKTKESAEEAFKGYLYEKYGGETKKSVEKKKT